MAILSSTEVVGDLRITGYSFLEQNVTLNDEVRLLLKGNEGLGSLYVSETGKTVYIENAGGVTLEVGDENLRYKDEDVYHSDNKPTKEDVGLGNVDNVKQAPSTRKIDATAPLSGGGDLSDDRTLTILSATTDARGAVQLNDDVNSTDKTQAATADALRRVNENASSSDDLDAHIADKSDPHDVTKAQVGLGNVDNVKQVPSTRKVNAKELSEDIELNAADVKARSDTWNPDWEEVTDKPTTFPPSSHTHTSNDITDLESERIRIIYVSSTEPSSPEIGSLWFEI